MKMKKLTTITTIVFAFLMVLSNQINAQNFKKLDASPLDIAAYPSGYDKPNKEIKIIYSRPQLKGRSLSKLAPNGEVWRTGANEAPELVLYTDFKLGDTALKAGSYSLLTIPGENEWTIIINSDLNTWGSYYHKESNDLVRVTVPVTTSEKSLEAFSIAFEESDNGLTMHLGWDTVRVAVPFRR
jgi:hypothetical protein